MFLPYIHGCSGYFMVLMFILQGPLDDPVDLFTIKTKLRGGGGGGGGDIHDIIACIKTAHQISNGLCKLRFYNINKVDTDEKT